jgi:DNA-binding HxlR family transcriptional regulator
MKDSKRDLLQLLLEPYVIDLLTALSKPKRFNDLVKYVKSRQTLTLKLSKLLKQGLIEHFPLKIKEGYANSYVISKKGKALVAKLEKL